LTQIFRPGRKEIIPKIKRITDKPVRFAFDTHHHGDHAYGNQIWVEQGATPVAHTGVVEEMRKYEPGRWGGLRKKPRGRAEFKAKISFCAFSQRNVFRRRQTPR
jgi:glyoxylase-like metal-dependent hydrolase (beta-lactamase superfamily II)